MHEPPIPGAAERRVRAYFFAAGAGFVPVLGVVAAIPVVLASLRAPRERRLLLAISLLSLVLNVALITYLYSGWRSYQNIVAGKPLRESDISRAEQKLHGLVRTLEYAKAIHGEYPHTLQELEGWMPSVYFADLWDPSTRPGCNRSYPFYARNSDGQSYQLFGLGPDCEPHTSDDVHPHLTESEMNHVGLKPSA